MAYPIWKDYFVTLGTSSDGSAIKFRLVQGSAVIYTGKAYPRPGSTQVSVRINDILADHFSRALPTEDEDLYGITITIQKYANSSWTTLYQAVFTRDWSYDNGFTPITDTPVVPVVPILNPLQYLPLWGYGGVWEADLIIAPNSPGDFCNDFNNDFLYYGATTIHLSSDEGDGDFTFLDLSQYDNLVAVQANGITYQVADMCGGFVLYYLNAYGGWDSLPVQGRTIRTDTYARNNREFIYNNRTYPARGTDNYATEVTEKYTLNIGPLTTEQSANMHHLLGSTFVYLHDIAKGRIHPVVLTNGAEEHKTAAGSLHFYEVEATLAQNRLRR